MKGTEKIIAHIQADANAEAEAILAQAEQQCEDIREDYEKKAAALYKEKIRTGVNDCQAKADSVERLQQMESRKSILAVKQEMVSASFDRARDMIVNLPEEQYVELLAKLAAEACVTKDEQILLNERDKAAVGAALVKAANAKIGGGKLTLADGIGNFAGGLILRRGSIEVNCTVELLVELCRSDMSAKLAGVLFE